MCTIHIKPVHCKRNFNFSTPYSVCIFRRFIVDDEVSAVEEVGQHFIYLFMLLAEN